MRKKMTTEEFDSYPNSFRENNVPMMGFPLLYLFVNTYTGESKWLPLEDGTNLDEYWERDPDQKPIPVYPYSWI